MSALKTEQIKGQVMDHLGLIAATIDKLDLVANIDSRLKLAENKGSKVTMGERVAAMILNGLGFMDDRLYMFPEFLENKPVARLFGPHALAAHFNDDALGRCLDAIHEYGETKLFSELAFDIGSRFSLLGKTARMDTTSLVVYGDYEEETESQTTKEGEANKTKEEETGIPFRITHGYSKDGRPDLKQVVLNLATTGKANLPIFMSAHSGNASDKVVLQEAAERMKKFADELEKAPAFLFVGDSAMYEKCVEKGGDMLWLSRVPHSHRAAKELLQTPDKDCAFVEVKEGYRIFAREMTHGDIKQRWLMVHSEQAYARDIHTLDKKIEKEKTEADKQLWHLQNQVFGCADDAHHDLKLMAKKLRYHVFSEITIKEVKKHNTKGRPKSEAVPDVVGYQIDTQVVQDKTRIDDSRVTQGRFILATNQLDKNALTDMEMLQEYKAQIHTEAGFKFIKNDAFEVSSVFLKKSSRIQALMMVMTLCLLVYNLAQYFLRKSLEDNNDSIPDPVKKKTKTPTMARVSRIFHGVQVIFIEQEQEVKEYVINVKDVLQKIIRYFGPRAMQIYGVS